MRHTSSTLGVLLLAASTATAQDLLTVGPAGPYPTIQSAVNAAQVGDVIEVPAGTYVEDVVVANKGLTLVCADATVARIEGTLVVEDLALGEFVLAANLLVTPRDADTLGFLEPYAVLVDDCDGAVRLQDVRAIGARGRTNSSGSFTSTFPGGAALGVAESGDVGLVDCDLDGGRGGPWGGVPYDGGDGGAALESHGVTRILLQRTVLEGGDGAFGESGGHGGPAAALFDLTEVVVAYSAFFGGDGGDAINLEGGSGGDGAFVSAGARVDDFGGLFFGGFAGMSWMTLGSPPVDGQAVTGQGLVVPVAPAHPSAVHAPSTVRVGQTWDLEVVGLLGEPVRPYGGPAPAFRWMPALRQPLMLTVDRLRSVALGGWRVLGSGGRTVYPQSAAQLAPGQDARVEWVQARVGGATPRLTSARGVVVLR